MVSGPGVFMRRVSLSLPTGVLAYLQDVTGEIEPSRTIVFYLAGRRRYKNVCEQYLGEEYHLVRWRPRNRAETALLSKVNGKQLTVAIVSDAKRHGVTIRLPSRGIW